MLTLKDEKKVSFRLAKITILAYTNSTFEQSKVVLSDLPSDSHLIVSGLDFGLYTAMVAEESYLLIEDDETLVSDIITEFRIESSDFWADLFVWGLLKIITLILTILSSIFMPIAIYNIIEYNSNRHIM